MATVGSLLSSNPAAAQIPPPAKKAGPSRSQRSRSRIVEAPFDHHPVDDQQPGGSDVHYGVVHYGADCKELSQTAKNPIRLSQGHPETTFRVQMRGLEPRTTYYYTVTSMESNGKSDG